MDWSRSYSAQWRVFRVDRRTWADGPQVEGIDSASVTRTADGALLESGSFQATAESFEEDYYRIVMTAVQDGAAERVDVATLLCASKSGRRDYGRDVLSIEGRSVLYPASVAIAPDGLYAPRGADGAEFAADILRGAINAPVEVEGSFMLNDHVVLKFGDTVLDAAWKILDAGGFTMHIEGDGTVKVHPMPSEPALLLDEAGAALLQPGVDYSADLSGIPNRYIAANGSSVAVAVNDDPNSPVSTVTRGYAVDELDTSPVPVNGETLAEYAQRMLEWKSVSLEQRTYRREYWPGVHPCSIARGATDGLEGDMRVQSQALDCKHGISVTEKAFKEVPLWQR